MNDPAAFSSPAAPPDAPRPDPDRSQTRMTDRAIRWCAWCGPAFIVVFFAGVLMAGLIPPPSPNRSADSIASFWRSHTDLKRAGLVLMMIGAGFVGPFSIAVGMQLKRMEGAISPMTYLQIASGVLGVLVIIIPTMLFMGTAFRPQRSPEVTQAMTDLAFIPFVINWPPVAAQCVAVAVVTLGRYPRQLFPRWVGYYNLWAAFLLIPGSLLVFFKRGAFAWNGLISFWLVAVLFGGWFLVMCVVVLRSLRDTQP